MNVEVRYETIPRTSIPARACRAVVPAEPLAVEPLPNVVELDHECCSLVACGRMGRHSM
jgi:hypothetical protein